jgi:hypothetical protein
VHSGSRGTYISPPPTSNTRALISYVQARTFLSAGTGRSMICPYINIHHPGHNHYPNPVFMLTGAVHTHLSGSTVLTARA